MRVSALQTQKGMFALVGLEPLAGIKEWWGLDQIGEESKEQIQSFFIQPAISELVTVAGEIVSGLVLDPVIGLNTAVSTKSGLILPLTQQRSAEIDPLATPQLDSQWGVVEVANNFGVAKLTLYYHPNEELAIQKKQMVAELADYCKFEGIDFILDLVIYTPAGEEFTVNSFQTAQLQAIQEFRSLPQILILQYPLDPLACATLTTELDIPWLVSSRGLRYPEFKETLRTALEGGAKGFYLYELSWPRTDIDMDLLAGLAQKKSSELSEYALKWLENCKQEMTTTTRDQLLELTRITNEFGEDA